MSTPVRGRSKKESGFSELKGKNTSTAPRDVNGGPTQKDSTASAFVSFPVVGIGASAGGLTAVSELLRHLPDGTRAAIVIIQHLDPKHGSLTADILSRG